MSKSLRHMSPEQRKAAIARRIGQSKEGGLGYWAARGAKVMQRLGKSEPSQH